MIKPIITKRLEIEPFSLEHTQEFFELAQDDGFNAFPITVYRQADIDSARDWILNAIAIRESTGLGKMAVRTKETAELIGMVGLTPGEWEGEGLVDLTYRFKQSVWGFGYGSEAAFATASFAFEDLKLPEITATITPDNFPSTKIAKRLGMTLEKRICLKNIPTDLFRMPKQNFQG
ncbi:MAG: GNAT family N-acetyltransferase [Proteobacteria bacterium]|nr:GNAT family N-acetyltransferase [Pseudomonadota bacterium]